MTEIKVFKAKTVESDLIELSSEEELKELYKLIYDEQKDFILSYQENGKTVSKVMITTNIASKIKNGDISLKSILEGKK